MNRLEYPIYFQLHILRKTVSIFVFINIYTGEKVDIFSRFVFNNIFRLTFILGPPFLPLRPPRGFYKPFIFSRLKRTPYHGGWA
jgi:hypothetical protein